MTREELEAKLAELESKLETEHTEIVDPTIKAKAESMLSFSIMDVKIAFETIGYEPTEEEQIAIEDAIIANKIAGMSQKAGRKTRTKW